MVNVPKPDPANSETEVGLRLYVAFCRFGFADTFRLTLPAKPFRLFMVMAKMAIWPFGTVKVAGFEARVKSGGFDP